MAVVTVMKVLCSSMLCTCCTTHEHLPAPRRVCCYDALSRLCVTAVWLLLLLLCPVLVPAETMESELSPILVHDTVGFVMKLKRLVIYECERSALQKRSAG